MIIGDMLEAYVWAKKTNLRDLGKEIGISAPTLSRIITGKSIDGTTMMKLLNWMFKD